MRVRLVSGQSAGDAFSKPNVSAFERLHRNRQNDSNDDDVWRRSFNFAEYTSILHSIIQWDSDEQSNQAVKQSVTELSHSHDLPFEPMIGITVMMRYVATDSEIAVP
jgi:hypothetical protein